MRKMIIISIMFIFTTFVFSLPEKTALEVKIKENMIEKKFHESFSEVGLEGETEATKFGIEIDFFKKKGVIKLTIDKTLKEFKEKEEKYKESLEEYFLEVVNMIKEEVKKDTNIYNINLILVTKKTNELLTKRQYIYE